MFSHILSSFYFAAPRLLRAYAHYPAIPIPARAAAITIIIIAHSKSRLNKTSESQAGLVLIIPRAMAPIELMGQATVQFSPKAKEVTTAKGITPAAVEIYGIVGSIEGSTTPVMEETMDRRLPMMEYRGFTV